MDTPDKRIARCLLTKTLTFIIVSLILFLFQLMLAGRDVAFQQAPMLVVISTIFLALNFVSGMAHDWVMKDGAKRALSFYLVVKVVRFFLVAAILLIYGLGRPTQHFGFRHQPLSALHRECSYLYDVLHQNGAKH